MEPRKHLLEVSYYTCGINKVRPMEVMIVVIGISKIVPTVSCNVRGSSLDHDFEVSLAYWRGYTELWNTSQEWSPPKTCL